MVKKNRLKRPRASTSSPKSSVEQKVEDRLSSLPDSILEHILSFLPILDGVRSTILARRFRNLWFSLHTLDINIRYFSGRFESPHRVQESWFWFSRFVNRVLILHRRPTLEKFVFSFCFELSHLFLDGDRDAEAEAYSDAGDDGGGGDDDWKCNLLSRAIDDLDGWILAAIHREPKFLHLSLGWISEEDRYILPSCVWSCNGVVELELDTCEIILSNLAGIQMGSLRILRMKHVVMSDEMLEQIICGCPVLEYLIIDDCLVNRVCFDAPSICKLELANSYGLNVDCPNLVSFKFGGCATGLNLVNLSSVKYADLSPMRVTFDEFKEFTEKLRHVESLKLSAEFVAMFTYAVLKDLPCIENHSKRIVLFMREFYIKGLFALLKNSPYLEELEVVLEPYVLFLSEDIELELAELFPHEFDWENEAADCICSMQYLKNVTIRGYDKRTLEFALDLAEVILRNAEVLDVLEMKVLLLLLTCCGAASSNPSNQPATHATLIIISYTTLSVLVS
ncbi:hypothetical protein Dimus_034078 [Dionaea muscipula]